MGDDKKKKKKTSTGKRQHKPFQIMVDMGQDTPNMKKINDDNVDESDDNQAETLDKDKS